ncbi:hypothetical protein N4U67_004274, partial [Salmonella enterica]|nr:hypothetical protein [Salmonella enterica]
MKKIIFAFAFMLMIPIVHADVASWSLGESKTAAQVQQEIEEAKRQAELILKYATECANGNNQSCSELEYIKSQGSELGLDANFVEQFQQTFTSEINAWLPPIKKAATYLLFTLGIIALVLKMVPLALKGADLGEIVKELIVFILVISLWYAIIINAKEWTDAIIDSFIKLANLANKNSMEATPVGVLKQGFVVVSKIFTGSY